MTKYNYDVNSAISIKDTNVPQFDATMQRESREKESLKFIENYDILLAQEKKQIELQEKKEKQQLFQQQQKQLESSNLLASARMSTSVAEVRK